MASIPWYFFGDTDCLMRGGKSGTDASLAQALSAPGVDVQAVVDDTGSATSPPGLTAFVSAILQNNPNRWPGVPNWTPSDWPPGWQIRFVKPTVTTVDELVLQPGVVAFRWPPEGGDHLDVSLQHAKAALGDTGTVRYGRALFQAIDQMVTTEEGRTLVAGAATQAGTIEQVDVLPVLQHIDRDLATTKAPPADFTAALNTSLTTIQTYLDVNPQGGVHVEIGWGEVVAADGDPDVPIFMREYPCGGFTA